MTEQQRKLRLCGQEVSVGERTAKGKTALGCTNGIKTNSRFFTLINKCGKREETRPL